MENFYLGADVSKGYSDFILLNQEKQVIEPNFQFDDTHEGHQKMYSFLENFTSSHPEAVIHVGFESTGGYENNWFHSLVSFKCCFNLKVARLNPKGINHSGKASLTRVITDKKSAFIIAEYLINHQDKINYDEDDKFYHIRKKWHYIQTLVKTKTRLLNQLESLLYVTNPNLLGYCRDGVSQWVLKLLQKFPSAKSVACASVEKISQIPYISKEKAKVLIDQAKRSVASVSDLLTENSISELCEDILRLENKIKNQSKILKQFCNLPQLDLLLTFPGIGEYSALGLLILIGTVERFTSVKQLASFFGLHPVFRQSGDGLWGFHMSKQGRAEARAILYMVAFSALQFNPLIAEVYHIQRSKGKCHMDAMGVCMHKVLRIVFGMLKNNQPFDANIDRKNQIRSTPKENKVSENKARRFQPDNDEDAPISRRQYKKRKEQEKSQDGIPSNTRSMLKLLPSWGVEQLN